MTAWLTSYNDRMALSQKLRHIFARMQRQLRQTLPQQTQQQQLSHPHPKMVGRARHMGACRPRLSCATSTVTPQTRSCEKFLQSAGPSRGCATFGILPEPQRFALDRMLVVCGVAACLCCVSVQPCRTCTICLKGA
jgi:hypothetical protein